MGNQKPMSQRDTRRMPSSIKCSRKSVNNFRNWVSFGFGYIEVKGDICHSSFVCKCVEILYFYRCEEEMRSQGKETDCTCLFHNWPSRGGAARVLCREIGSRVTVLVLLGHTSKSRWMDTYATRIYIFDNCVYETSKDYFFSY